MTCALFPGCPACRRKGGSEPMFANERASTTNGFQSFRQIGAACSATLLSKEPLRRRSRGDDNPPLLREPCRRRRDGDCFFGGCKLSMPAAKPAHTTPGVLRRGVGNFAASGTRSVQAAGIDTRRAETLGSVCCIAQYSDESPTGKAEPPTSAKEICREIPSNIFKPSHSHDDHRKPPHFVCPSGLTASASSRPPASDLRASRSCSFLT